MAFQSLLKILTSLTHVKFWRIPDILRAVPGAIITTTIWLIYLWPITGLRSTIFYRNNGDGSFTKITDQIICQEGGHSNGCSWADYNNDGYLDLFVANVNNENNFYTETTAIFTSQKLPEILCVLTVDGLMGVHGETMTMTGSLISMFQITKPVKLPLSQWTWRSFF